MTPREYARLQGAPDFVLNDVTRGEAIMGFGDAVCVPAYEWLATQYLAPLVKNCRAVPA
jgi:DNA (cytosine-5)-methyltransferase 1